MLSRKGRIYSFGSLTLVGLVASLVGVATQSPEAAATAGAITATATQTGILSVLQNKGFEITIKLLENLGAISTNLGTDDARQILIKVAESLNKSGENQNHDIAKAVRQAILSIIENEKAEIADKTDKDAIEKILKTTEDTWAWVELLEQDNLINVAEEKIPHFFAVKAEDIAKIESPVKESQWKLFILEIARQNNCDLTQKSLDKISKSLYKKFPQSLREVFAQDFANKGAAYGKLLLALVGDISSSQAEILDEIIDVSQKQDKYQLEIREWFKTILAEIKKPSAPLKIPVKLPVSGFPSRVNFFTGRKTILKNIKKSLKEHKTAALCGVHGLGKSSIATEFAYLNEKSYAHILFIRAFGAEFDKFVGEIVADLPYPTDEMTTPAQKLGFLRDWLAKNDDWLLILDNVDDVRAINEHQFTNLGGEVLFTSNDELIYQIGNRVEVPNMDEKEAAMLLYQHWKGIEIEKFEDIPAEKREPAREIAGKFGNSPLAMTFVGFYLAEENESLTEFLETYQDKRVNLLRNYKFLSNYQHQEVAAPFLLAFEAITNRKDESDKEILISEILKNHLKIAAFLAPDDIPEDFLKQCTINLYSDGAEFFADNELFKEARKRLAKSRIFKRDADKQTFSTHRLVQEIMRFEINEEENLLLETIAGTLNENVDVFDYTNREKVELYLPHLESFIEYLLTSETETENITKADNQTTGVLSFIIGEYYYLFGQFENAKKYFLLYRDICEKFYGDKHMITAESYNNLGLVYDLLGDDKTAEKNYQKALQIYLNIFGENHQLTAAIYNNLGVVYASQDNPEKAEEMHQKAFGIRLNIFDKNHPDIAASYNNLGLVYYSQGDYQKAEENHQKALGIILNIYGENHPDTAKSYDNLGDVYENMERFDEAERFYEKALEIFMKFLPEQHPDVQRVKRNLERVREKMGK